MITARVKGRGKMRRREIESKEEGKRDRIVEKRGKSSFRSTIVVESAPKCPLIPFAYPAQRYVNIVTERAERAVV